MDRMVVPVAAETRLPDGAWWIADSDSSDGPVERLPPAPLHPAGETLRGSLKKVRRNLDDGSVDALLHWLASQAPTVFSIAREYERRGGEFDDLVQEGMTALVAEVGRIGFPEWVLTEQGVRGAVRAALRSTPEVQPAAIPFGLHLCDLDAMRASSMHVIW